MCRPFGNHMVMNSMKKIKAKALRNFQNKAAEERN